MLARSVPSIGKMFANALTKKSPAAAKLRALLKGQKKKMTTAKVAQNNDPFENLDSLRLSQDFTQVVGAAKQQLTIPVRKPNRQDWVRVHPDPDYRIETCVVELKEERETYLVAQPLWLEVFEEIVPKILFTGITRQGTLFVWPVRRPGDDGRIDSWSQSAVKAAELAMTKWVRVSANMQAGGYDVYEALGNIPDPDWPATPLSVILRTAFRGKFIDSPDHPVLKKLRGEA